MGMYDELKCHYPLPDPEMNSHTFQTKDFDCELKMYEILEDGTLVKNEHEMEVCPEEERPYYGKPEWNKGGWWQLVGSMRVVEGSEHKAPIPHHGDVYFYDFREEGKPESEWMEYVARFTNGKVESIKRIGGAERS